MKIFNASSNRFFYKIAEFTYDWKSRYILKPIFNAILPIAIVFYDADPIHSKLQQISPELVTYLDKNVLTLLIWLACVIFLFTLFIAFIKKSVEENNSIEDIALYSLLKVLTNVIGAKSERFSKQISILKTNTSSKPCDVFNKITQPLDQIKLIAQAAQSFFEIIDKESVTIKLGLAEVTDGVIQDNWLYFAPHNYTPRTQPFELKDVSSALAGCLKKKSIIIVEDTEKESAKKSSKYFQKMSDDTRDEGSIICCPILNDHGKVIYILSISADKKNYFQLKKKTIYQKYIEHFSLRMRLEHNLISLKELSTKKCAEASI